MNQQPADCRILIEKLKACGDDQLLVELQHIKTWNIGKVRPTQQNIRMMMLQSDLEAGGKHFLES